MVKKTNRKKGELVGQIFIYILGIITVGFLLLLGLNAINKLNSQKCTVQETQFVTDLASAFEKNKGKGISRVETFTTPCDTTAVCFVDRQIVDLVSADGSPQFDSVDADGRTFRDKYGFIVASVESGSDVNVFLHTADGYKPLSRFEVPAPVDLPNVNVGGNQVKIAIRCIDADPLAIRFKGKGLAVEVADASSN